jgi:hypothetical protein
VTATLAMPHDGATSLAARPRWAASRRTRKPAARRRLIRLPFSAAQPIHDDSFSSRLKPSPPPGYTIVPDVRLDY